MWKVTLETLYPFLRDNAPAQCSRGTALLESVRQKASHSCEAKHRFFDENADAVVTVAHALAAVYERGGRLLTMGNGGSGCDAARIAVEFVHPITVGRPALSAINLDADV